MEILIVGGGYIGMYTARRLERLLRRGEVTVTVVDPRGYMTYQPFLAEAAAGSVEPRHVIAPLPRVLRRTRVLTGTIVRIDQASHQAVFAPARGPERVLRYDVLVLAAVRCRGCCRSKGWLSTVSASRRSARRCTCAITCSASSPQRRRPTTRTCARPRSRSSTR
jgi:Pyridine nucleotide-disulphide oxidoreductase